jgi:hypothetical protein
MTTPDSLSQDIFSRIASITSSFWVFWSYVSTVKGIDLMTSVPPERRTLLLCAVVGSRTGQISILPSNMVPSGLNWGTPTAARNITFWICDCERPFGQNVAVLEEIA